MIAHKIEFDKWCKDIRDRYEQQFNMVAEKAPNLTNLDGDIQERIMRCAVEARHFGIDDNRDELAILAHHTLLNDAVKNRVGTNDPLRIYGFVLTDSGQLCRV